MRSAVDAAGEQIFGGNGPVIEVANDVNAYFVGRIQGQTHFIRSQVVDARSGSCRRVLGGFDNGHQIVERLRIPRCRRSRNELYFVVPRSTRQEVEIQFQPRALAQHLSIVDQGKFGIFRHHRSHRDGGTLCDHLIAIAGGDQGGQQSTLVVNIEKEVFATRVFAFFIARCIAEYKGHFLYHGAACNAVKTLDARFHIVLVHVGATGNRAHRPVGIGLPPGRDYVFPITG